MEDKREKGLINAMFCFISAWLEGNKNELRMSCINSLTQHLLLVQAFYLNIEDDSERYYELIEKEGIYYKENPMSFQDAYRELSCCFDNYIFNK